MRLEHSIFRLSHYTIADPYEDEKIYTIFPKPCQLGCGCQLMCNQCCPEPSPLLTHIPTLSPTNKPTPSPTNEPTPPPTYRPTPYPTTKPTPPTNEPTPFPTLLPYNLAAWYAICEYQIPSKKECFEAGEKLSLSVYGIY